MFLNCLYPQCRIQLNYFFRKVIQNEIDLRNKLTGLSTNTKFQKKVFEILFYTSFLTWWYFTVIKSILSKYIVICILTEYFISKTTFDLQEYLIICLGNIFKKKSKGMHKNKKLADL